MMDAAGASTTTTTRGATNLDASLTTPTTTTTALLATPVWFERPRDHCSRADWDTVRRDERGSTGQRRRGEDRGRADAYASRKSGWHPVGHLHASPSMLHAYMGLGLVGNAWKVFDGMPDWMMVS
uniref:Uncharacterized protein n=1 Tax=Arundo donax TaxID=35708 RepID=A0A0A8Y0P7_ARUDO